MRHRRRCLQRAVQHHPADEALPLLRLRRGQDPRGGHAREPRGGAPAALSEAGGRGLRQVAAADRRQAREHLLRRALLPLLRERVPRQDLRTAPQGHPRQRRDAPQVPHGRGGVEPRAGACGLGHVRSHAGRGGVQALRLNAAGGLPRSLPRLLLLELDGRRRRGVELPAGLPAGPALGPAGEPAALGRHGRGPAGGAAAPLPSRASRLLWRQRLPPRLPRQVHRRLWLCGERALGRQGGLAGAHLLPPRGVRLQAARPPSSTSCP
mmetsp:Transcript_27123/g.77849  ORF Transcript_27123/g.77849 Transcript_27123/m.77849 type:complete len:266 (-) Transcript_27123:601-1398(-)